MYRVRCEICRQHLPTLKSLKSHYFTSHSKFQIIRQLLKDTILSTHKTGVVMRRHRKRRAAKSESIFENEKVQISCNKDTIVIQDNSNNINLIELTLQDNINLIKTLGNQRDGELIEKCVLETRPDTKTPRKKRSKKSKKTFHIGIRKLETTISLDDHTGDFYECHCMEKNAKTPTASDTESCSDTGRSFYCKSCGNGYNSPLELAVHEQSHKVQCRLCNQSVYAHNYKEHTDQHLIKVYVCHFCGFEFVCSENLQAHLQEHFEQKLFEDVLDMEQEYNNYYINFSTGDYCTDLNNILFFLTYPHDLYYSRNVMFMKIVCDICYQEFYIYDYERHLKVAHYMR